VAIEHRKIEVGSPLHTSALTLRDEVLRRPIGRALSATDIEYDRLGHHFVAVEGEIVVGCVGLYPERDGVVRLRQMAVAPHLQGRGIGAGVLRFAEAWAREHNVTRIELHARVTAVGFYERLGYAAKGEIFDEVTVPHRAMWKQFG
jgi:GNAT superfamily N-acetyltransferase